MPLEAKIAMRLSAAVRMRHGGISRRLPTIAPSIDRQHKDGPVLRSLDGSLVWLSFLERVMTMIGLWSAWDVEWRRFPLTDPLPTSETEA